MAPAQRVVERDLADAQRVGDGAAGQVLHDDERRGGAPILGPGLADVVDRHHVRVSREVGRGAGLPLKAPDGRRFARVGLGEQLDRHASVQRAVLGAPDLAMPPEAIRRSGR